MSTTKTPLQLVDSIQNHASELFELRKVSQALLEAAAMENVEVMRTIVRSLANTSANLLHHVTDIYWDSSDLKRQIEDAIWESTKDADDTEEGEPDA